MSNGATASPGTSSGRFGRDPEGRLGWWLNGACRFADMGAALLVEHCGRRQVIEALDTVSVSGGVLFCGEQGLEFSLDQLAIVGYRTDEECPWQTFDVPLRQDAST